MRDNPGVPSTRLHDDADLTPDDEPATPARAARRAELDAVCAAAADLARASAEELAEPGTVGGYLGVEAEGERLVVHSFECLSRGYRGWRWAVSVARAPRSRTATVCEVVLLPATDALLPPEWVPWSQRLAPGDLGPGDELPYRVDDPNLEPGYAATGEDDEHDRVAVWELGLGRSRVLSREGRETAAERWYRGSHGPTADVAVHAAASCSSCGYLMHLAGSMRQMFGVCANEWSPSDGKVVSLDHGCGAHSETDAPTVEPEPLPEPILDEAGLEPVILPARGAVEPVGEIVEPVAGVAVDEAVAEVSEPGTLEVVEAPVPDETAEPAEVVEVPVADEAAEPADVAETADDVAETADDVAETADDVAATVAPDEDEGEVPDPEAPAHDVPDPEAPAHAEPDPETPAHEHSAHELAAHEQVAADPVADVPDVPPEEPGREP
jgi:hypothetical protein